MEIKINSNIQTICESHTLNIWNISENNNLHYIVEVKYLWYEWCVKIVHPTPKIV